LKRHLDNEPVTARPPSTAYRFQTLLRRNKLMSVSTALVLMFILVGTVISIGQTLRARRELRRALAAEAQALTADARPRLAQQNYAVAEPLLREGLCLTEKHDVDAGYRLYVMSFLGASLAGQKNYTDAEPLLLQSCEGLQPRQASLSPHLNAPRRITESLERLAQLYDSWGKPAQAAEWKKLEDHHWGQPLTVDIPLVAGYWRDHATRVTRRVCGGGLPCDGPRK
jgi:hypothetical protein